MLVITKKLNLFLPLTEWKSHTHLLNFILRWCTIFSLMRLVVPFHLFHALCRPLPWSTLQCYLAWTEKAVTECNQCLFRCMLMLFWLGEISLRKFFTAEFLTNGRCLGVFTWVNPVQVWTKKSCLSYPGLVSSDCIAEAWGDVARCSLCYSQLSCSMWTVGEPLCTSEHTHVPWSML